MSYLRLTPHLPTSDVRKMVAFYEGLAFSLQGTIAERDGLAIFAHLKFGDSDLRIEHWGLPNWDALKEGFAVTTLWIDTDDIEAVAERLRAQNIPFEGPGREDYGTVEIELFDPEGFRIIFAQAVQ